MSGGTHRMRASFRLGVRIIGLIVLGSCLVSGQSATATIVGLVRDTSGALVAGVSITAKHVDTGLTRGCEH